MNSNLVSAPACNDPQQIIVSGLARVSSGLMRAYSERLMKNPLDLKISYLEKSIMEMINDSQEKLEKLKSAAAAAEDSCLLKKSTRVSLLFGFSVAAVATIVSLVTNTIQNPENQQNQISLTMGGLAAVIGVITEYTRALKDDADEEVNKARALQREAELNQAQMLCTFLTELKNFKKRRRKINDYDMCTAHFKKCLDQISKMPAIYRKYLPTREKLMASLISGFPEDHPLKKIVDDLFMLATNANHLHSPQSLKGLNRNSLMSSQEVDEKQSSSNLPSQQGTAKFSSAACNSSIEAPSLLKPLSSSEELDQEYKKKWEELEKFLDSPVKSLELYGHELLKNGSFNKNDQKDSPRDKKDEKSAVGGSILPSHSQVKPADVIIEMASPKKGAK